MKGQQQRQLPSPPPSFVRRKQRILELLAVPEAEYTDASPKGSVDEGIRELISEISDVEGFVTTSSCAGRVSVFVEGRKTASASAGGSDIGERTVKAEGEVRDSTTGSETVAAVGGKGGGGAWLFVSHGPVTGLDPDDLGHCGKEEDEEGVNCPVRDVKILLGLRDPDAAADAVSQIGSGTSEGEVSSKDIKLIHFKFEPMILHVLTASLEHAQLLLRCGLQAGFRESGAINLLSTSTPTSPFPSPAISNLNSTSSSGAAATEGPTPIVAIRSMGLSLESLVGVRENEVTKCTVSDEYLASLLRIANERFVENARRIERFRSAFLKETTSSLQESDGRGKKTGMKMKGDGTEWEDASARRERKRAEGLRRKAELQCRSEKGDDSVAGADVDLVLFPTDTNST